MEIRRGTIIISPSRTGMPVNITAARMSATTEFGRLHSRSNRRFVNGRLLCPRHHPVLMRWGHGKPQAICFARGAYEPPVEILVNHLTLSSCESTDNADCWEFIRSLLKILLNLIVD